ncbi:MAG: T9SS type A sorting domain-containing protein [candidate division Zixibacteria bacterium]|nr:T9SS type A sorting domain-containing protein [candidate division Zixibacteria bacterium]
MKKLLLQVCLVMAISVCAFGMAFANQTIQVGNAQTDVALLSQNQNELTMQVDVGALNLIPVSTDEGSFVMLTVDGFARSHNIGEPNLPMVNRVLSIPYGCQFQAEIIDYEMEEIYLADYASTDPIMPAQPSLSKSDDPDYVRFEYNRGAYEKSGYYKLPVVETKELGTLRAHRLGVVSVAPVEYDPLENKVRVYTNLTIKVNFQNPDWLTTEQTQRNKYSPFFEIVYSQLFNYNDDYPIILDDLVTYPVKYLIVADRMFETQLQPFIDWKIKKGFTVITGYTDEIGYSGNDIRDYIQNLYDTEVPAPSFVLLVGDDQQIPAFQLSGHISDLPFCEYTGDDIPEIYYGRFSAQNTDLLQPQIDKTLEYEMYTMPDPSYLGDVTLVAGVDANWAPVHGNGQINYGTDHYFNVAHGIDPNVWLYPQSDDPGAGPAIRETINNGTGLVNYSAHCGHLGWTDPSFETGDINNLTNAHKYLLSIGNCCLSNTFGDDYSTPTFGEVWLQAPEKGGVGHIGGTNSTYWDEDYWWGVGAGPIVVNPTYEQTGMGAYDGMFHDHGEPISEHYITNDAIIFCGNMAVVEGGGMAQYYWEIYHLMGDPSITNYNGVPSENTIAHDPTILLSAPTFSVQADPTSYVGISMNGVLHGQGYVDVSGMVNIEIDAFSQPGTADIVITGQNKIPYIETIVVITPEGPYVVFDEFGINDEGGDGQVDFGEFINLDMQLINVGPDDATDVVATLLSDDEHVMITDDTESYGDIQGDFHTVNIEDAFAFSVSDEVPDGHVINFQLDVTGTAADEWTSYFNITAHAPVVEFVDVTIDDSAGNGNGIIDAGETVEVIVSLQNTGTCAATSVIGEISENDEYVTLSDGNGSWGDIAPDETVNNSADIFVVVAEDDFPPGHSVLFDLNVTADGNYAVDCQFTLRAVESFEYDNAGWEGVGVWEWGIPGSGPGAAYDGDNVWGTVLGGEYPSNADDELVTRFYSITNSAASFSFFHWYNMESGWDGGNVQLSADGGSSWDILQPDIGYPDGDVTGLDGEPGFSGESGAWQEVFFDLGAYEGETVKIRFRFGSDGSITRDGWYLDAVVITGAIIWSAEDPVIEITPGYLSAVVDSGDTEIQTITVSNTGAGLLEFSAFALMDEGLMANTPDNNSSDYIDPDYLEKYEIDGRTVYNYVGPKVEQQTNPGDGDVITDFGGPDEFGYRWKDSNESGGPHYDWIDIAGIGTPISHVDDSNEGPFEIGFEFPFYGNTFTTFRSCSNGWISFTSTSTSYNYSGDPIPDTDEPNNLVAPFWDDQNFNDGGECYYYSNGIDSLIVSYIGVAHYDEGGPYTYQIILLADGNITFQYQSVNDPLDSYTMGIENEDGTIGLMMANMEFYVQAELAVKIVYPTFWLTVSQAGGMVYPDESMDLDVTFDATEVSPGTYTGSIWITSNDPENQSVNIPCTLSVIPTGIEDGDYTAIPVAFSLKQNYPNPFNPKTDISFGLPKTDHVTLEVYDIMGRSVTTLIDEILTAGIHTIIWDGTADDGTQVTSGVYFYKLSQGENVTTKKMMMLK